MADLSPGTVLSHYRIISKIGAGGMGEVYRAQDTELGRSVALKFLSSEFDADQNRLKRFIQEAKAASALNHPNILTVYEIGRTENHTFIATEFVEGLNLRLLIRQPLKLIEILDVAIQIASALVAAHAAGIVHRDIKPDNIMVRTDGLVKVLDFGLAKLTEKHSVSLSGSGSEATTVAMVNTEPGAILGTVAYMAPEQAAGREVDARADIWSLGVVLYEMITSRAPFEGASKSHIIVAIMDQEPRPINELVPDVPQPLEWLVAEALTKDPEERCQTAREMLGKLKRLKQRIESGAMPISTSDINRSSSQSSQSPQTEPNPIPLSAQQTVLQDIGRPSGAMDHATTASLSNAELAKSLIKRNQKAFAIALVLGLIVVASIGFGFYKLLRPQKEPGPSQMRALTTSGQINGEDINGQVSISPDGKYVVCAANDAKQQASLWIRQVSTNSTVRIVPAESGAYLATAFSPDGEQVYYVAQLERNGFVPTLYRIPVLGGTPTKLLARVSGPIGFSPDGRQFAFVRKNPQDTTLMVANTDGSGEAKSIAVRKTPDSFSTSGPSWSPDAKRIAVGVINGAGVGYSSVAEVQVVGGELKPIGSQKWATVGRVVWLADGSGLIMTAQPESSSVGTQVWFVPYPDGEARKITNDLNAYGEVSLGLTADSTAIATIQQSYASSIWITTPYEDESKARQILKTIRPDILTWTPDERIVYATRTGETWDLWLSNRDAESKPLTSDAFVDLQPGVCADGRIVFQSNRGGGRNIWRIDEDGSNLKQLTSGDFVDEYPVCSADGRFVVFMSGRSGTSSIWKVGIDGGSPVQVTQRSAQFPSISPDGKLIAYFYTDEKSDNQPKLAIIPFEGGDHVKSVDLPRSAQPFAFAWMPDGKSVAYLDNASGILNVWSQPIDGGPSKQLTNFKSEFVNSFAVSREGKIAVYRFHAIRDIVVIKDFR